MKPTVQVLNDLERETHELRQANAQARRLLLEAGETLRAVLQDQAIRAETPMEAWTVMDTVAETMEEVCRRLESAAPAKTPSAAPIPDGPTRQQGQFLAFIREYVMRNYAGVAPTHAEFQRFFNLTPPSVNSMLIRLEQRGFIRRVPHQARAIELTIAPDWIPPLDRPFKF